MAFRIYTKTGDKGETGLYGGSRLSKDHVRITAYGTVDELNAHIGYLYESIEVGTVKKVLLQVQNNLFTIGGMLAKDPAKNLRVPEITLEDTAVLEQVIDVMETELEPLKQFILPSGDQQAALAHITRTVCRRAERDVITLHRSESVEEEILMYLNRLADFLFVAARYLNMKNDGVERPWDQPDIRNADK